MATKSSTQDLTSLVINKVESQAAYADMVTNHQINANELYLVEGDSSTTYTLSQSGGSVTLTGSDGSTSSVTVDAAGAASSAVSTHNSSNTAHSDIRSAIPTSTSQLTNDSGFITTSDIPEGAAASTTTPAMDGTASTGSELAFARGDHVHPTDTSRASASNLSTHTSNTSNPHSVTAAQVGAVPTSRKINDIALTSDITITAADLGAITSETQLSKGTTSGSGNAVTDISVSNHTITLTKGTTFATKSELEAVETKATNAMTFIGTLGTGGTATSLPSSPTVGDTYKVITAGTYSSIACKVGDMLVYSSTGWVMIPSGDEPSGTVTNIATGTGLTGGPITTTGTISHASYTANNAAAVKVGNDATGHVVIGSALAASDVGAAPTSHASSATTYGKGTDSNYGHLKLSDSTTSTSSTSGGIAATPAAVKAVKDAIPTKTSQLTNDSGYITSSDVPEGAAASTTTPAMDGTAAVGTETAFARGDHVHPTDTSRAPTSHASSATTYGTGTSSNYGHLKLSDSTSSTSGTSGGIAATPSAVKAAYDLANGKQDPIAATQFLYYGTSSTAAGTQTKQSTISAITALASGLSVRIKFTNAQTYNGQPKLQINSLTATNIVRMGTTAAARYEWQAGEVVDFVYDGTNFIIQDGAMATTTYYGQTILSSATDSTSEAMAATPKAVNTVLNSIPSASTTSPSMDGTASYGSGTTWARADHVHPTDTSRAPTNHATSATTYGTGTSSNYGHLKLSDSTSSTSSTSGGIAATPAAVKSAYDLANSKQSALTFDDNPTENSSNPVKSSGIWAGLASKSPTTHSSTSTTYGVGDGTNYGHLKLSASTSSSSGTSSGVAATPSAVKAAYDLANGKQNAITVVYGTLAAASWSNGSQTVSFTGLTASQNAVLGLASTSTVAQDEAAAKAKLKVTAQAAGSITIQANGTVPTVDIPLALMLC